MVSSRPLEVGVVHAGAHAQLLERTEARIALALFANDEGYALAETFEVDGNAVRDEVTLQAVSALAERLDAEALIVSGPVDRDSVQEIADRVRMVVRLAL